MDYRVNMFVFERPLDRVTIANVCDDKPSASGLEHGFDIPVLDCRVIIRIERIDDDDSLSSRNQPLGEMTADESGSASDEDSHVRRLARNGRE